MPCGVVGLGRPATILHSLPNPQEFWLCFTLLCGLIFAEDGVGNAMPEAFLIHTDRYQHEREQRPLIF